ncbi:MAG: chemotaxis protein CheA [Pseudomonadota bacterium]
MDIVETSDGKDRRSVLNSEVLEIQQAFTSEASEMLADMESALLSLEKQPCDSEEFKRLFRSVHTIKGSASIVGVATIEHFCHYIENTLVRIREHRLPLSSSLIALFLQCHDHIDSLMNGFNSCCSGQDMIPPDQHSLLIEQLSAWDTHTRQTNHATPESYSSDVSATPEPETCFIDDAESDLSEVCDVSVDDTVVLPSAEAPILDKTSRDTRVVRMEAAKLDQLSDLIVELVTASSVLESKVRQLADMSIIESSVHVADLISQIQEKSMAFRMVPVQTLFRRFLRMIHDIGNTTGKNIRLMISGGDTELDRVIADKLYEPLLHLVRNAADHGIEPSPDRVRLGKDPVGTIHLSAFHDSGSIIIRVNDDGQGIDIEAVAQKAVEKGLTSAEGVISSRDLLDYIFEPGFSTLNEATMLSGRGVGMDVVKKAIESLRGRIAVETCNNSGTTFRIRIPLSLSLMNGFLVALGENLYILPMDIVLETLELSNRSTMTNGCIRLRDKILPCMDFREILCITGPPPPLQYVVVVSHEDTCIGFLVDSILGEIKTVIKPLGKIYHNVTCVSGVSILGDGSIAMFLEVDKLIRDLENRSSCSPCQGKLLASAS